MGDILTPFFVGLIIAYLLQHPINLLAKKTSYSTASIIVFTVFSSLVLTLMIIIMPAIFLQIERLGMELPHILAQFKAALIGFAQKYPAILPQETLNKALGYLQQGSEVASQEILKICIKMIPSALSFAVGIVLIPLIVFFLNKDKDYLISVVASVYPKKRDNLVLIVNEINEQIGNYIRGKVVQMCIVTILCGIVFKYFALKYALLFAFSMGVSVFIPYVGAVLATAVFLIVAYGQFGLTTTLWQIIIAFSVVQVLDANILVPIIFSEAVSLHPIFIIIAIIFFGGIGGVLGVFFAIPLASMIKAFIIYWPVEEQR
ncbi:AI-2E family transporter [bacterium]|nr:AI-2E family transporter [bacterium]